MVEKTIEIKRGQVLSDILPNKEIPTNTILNKTLTGCGATYGEIVHAKRHSIIIEPNVPVILGKKAEHPFLFAVYEGITKEDVKAYLEERAIFPELYSAPKGWYGTHYVARLSKELPEDTLRQMHGYYEKLLRKYPDVVTVKDVVALTGYTLTTVHNWCSRGSLKAFQKGLKFCIPKIFLVDFFCSLTFRSITRKSLWHIQTLNEFSRKMKRK